MTMGLPIVHRWPRLEIRKFNLSWLPPLPQRWGAPRREVRDGGLPGSRSLRPPFTAVTRYYSGRSPSHDIENNRILVDVRADFAGRKCFLWCKLIDYRYPFRYLHDLNCTNTKVSLVHEGVINAGTRLTQFVNLPFLSKHKM